MRPADIRSLLRRARAVPPSASAWHAKWSVRARKTVSHEWLYTLRHPKHAPRGRDFTCVADIYAWMRGLETK